MSETVLLPPGSVIVPNSVAVLLQGNPATPGKERMERLFALHCISGANRARTKALAARQGVGYVPHDLRKPLDELRVDL